MAISPRKTLLQTRRQIRRALRHRQAAGRISLVGLLLFGMIVSSVPTAQAVVQSNSAVDATVNSAASTTLNSLGNKINLKVVSPVADPGSLTQSVTQYIDKSRMALTGLQDITAPAEWVLSYSTDGGSNWTTTTPTNATEWAAVNVVKATGPVVSDGTDGNGLQISTGDATQAYPTGGSVNAAASGDGYNLFFDERGNFYNIWHHNGAGAPGIDCHVRSGARCAGNWPFTWPTGAESGPNTVTKSYGWYDPVDHEIWFSSNMRVDGTGMVGFACVDVRTLASPQFCGGSKSTGFHGIQAGGVGGSGSPGLGSAAGRIFTLNPSTGDILCLDLRADYGNGAPCSTPSISFPSYPSAQQWAFDGTYGGYAVPTLQALAGRIYAYLPKSVGDDGLVCIEPTTMAICAGWGGTLAGDPKAAEFNTAHLWPLPNAQGEIQAICGGGSWVGCYNFDGSVFTGTKPPSSAVVGSYQLEAYGMSDPVVAGSKIFSPRLSGADTSWISCWDMATNAGCTGINGKVTNVGLYTVNIDPYNETCLWTNTDPGVIQTWDTITGSSSCTPRSIAFDAGVVVPRMGCDSRSAIHAWKAFTLTNPPASSYSAAYLTVKTEEAVNVTGWVKVPLTTGTALDLSSLPVAATGQRPKFVVEFVNRTSGSDANAKVSAVGDSPELCLTPTVIKCAPLNGNGPYGSNVLLPAQTLSLTGKGDWTDGSATLNQLANDASVLVLPASLFDECSTKITGSAKSTNSTGPPVVGATVTLLDTSGNVINYPNDWPDTSLRGQPVQTTTASDGTYDLGWVFAGDYKVRFSDVPTTQVKTTTVVTGSTATTKTTTDSSYTTTTLASITATPVVGTNAVVDAIYTLLPSMTKEFVPSTIAAGGTGTLVFTITNATGNPAQSGLGFVDQLPSGLVVASIPNRQYTCPAGGTAIYDNPAQLTAVAGSSTITALNFSMNAGTASCFFSVDVTSTNGGTYTNGAGNVTTTGIAPPNTANLGVSPVTNAGAFICTPTLYHHDSTQLYLTGLPDYTKSYKLGSANVNVTALGFNGLDGFMYGLANQTSAPLTKDHLIKIDSTGAKTDLGALSGVTLTSQAEYAGDMDDSGHLLVFNWNEPTKLYSIDVYTRVVTVTTLSGFALNSNIQDFAYSNGKLYSVNGASLQIIDVATGVVTNKALPAGTAIQTTAAYMTMDGRLIVFDYYQTAHLREIVGYNTSSPTVSDVGWNFVALYSDGAACHDATPAPATRPDTSSAKQGATQTVSPLANDIPSTMVGAALDPSTVKLCDTGQTAPNCNATQLTKPEGTYSVNNNGEIVFVPNPSFTGVASGVTYQVTDNKGESSTGAYTPTVIAPPAATNDTSSGAYLATQTVNPVTNDTPGVGGAANGTTLVQNSVRLCGGTDVAPNCTQTSVTIPGQGEYRVDTTTGIISFIPVVGFTGTATPITYSVTDSLGQKSSATYTPTVNPAPRITKEFVPNEIVAGGTSTLVFTITNTPGNPAWTGLGFVDTLPSGLVVAAIPNKQTNCAAGADTLSDNPTQLTATAGAASITLVGASINSTVATCKYSVDVTATTAGNYSNGSGNITSTTMVPPATPATLGIANPNNTGQFLCTAAIYRSDATQLYVNGSPDYGTAFKLGSPISAGDITGLGFNGLDGYIYGIKVGTAGSLIDGHLIKIDSTGAKTDMGALTGAALPQTNIGGDMDDSGHLLLWGWNDTSKLYVVDVYTRNVTTVALSGVALTSWAQDLAYANGKMYAVHYGSLDTIDVATGVITRKPVAPASNLLSTSTFMTSSGRLIFYDYNTSHLKEVTGYTSSTPAVVDLGVDVIALNSDGTACHDATPAPATRPDTTFGAKGATQTAQPLANDIPSSMVGAALVASSVKLCDVGQVAPNCNATSLTKPEGTYTVNSSGDIIFTPNASFTGVAGGVTYQVTDNKGESSTGTYTPTVVAPPTAVNDATSGAYMAPQSVNPITATGTADSIGLGAAANGVTLVQNSVRLCGPSDTAPNCTQTSVTIAGQGTYTVDTTTGVITWTPVTGFAGTATPITYSVADSLGQKASATYTPTTNAAPRMSKAFGPDNIAAGGVTSITFTITNTTPAAAWTGLAFVDTLPSGMTVDANPNVTKTCTAGTITAAASSGTITVTGVPLAAATTSCSITVEVKVANTGVYTNSANNISSTTIMPPENPATLTVVAPISTGSFACNPYVFTERTGGLLMVENPMTGTANQLGAAAGGEIQALGFNGQDGYLYGYVRAALTSPVVAAGHIVKISSTGTVTDVGVPKLNGVNMAANANVYAGDMDDSGNLFFLSTYTSTTTAYLVNVTTLVTRQITLSTGIGRQDVAFFKGKFYTAESSTVYAISPSASSDSWSVATPTTMTPTTSGTQQAAYANSSEFFYLASTVGFKMVNNITGSSPTVTALGADTYGSQTDGAACHQAAGVYTPAANDDTITTAYNTQQVYTPLGNDVPSLSGAALNPASVKLCATNETAPSCTQTSLTVSGQGTYTVNQTTGAVTFVPLATFTGTATPVNYQVSDTAATPKTASALLSPIIGPPPAPTATNDTSINGQDVNQTINPLTNDSVAAGFNLVATSVKLCATGTTTNCNLTTLTVANEGTYTVNPTTGAITFDPLPNFVGSATPVRYAVTDSSSQIASATYTPTVIGVPAATPDTSVGAWDVNQTLTPLSNDSAASGASLAASPIGICVTGTPSASCTGTTITVANQGTYTLNSNGSVTFDPLPSFTGTATPIEYAIVDSIGQKTYSTLTPTVTAATAPEATPQEKQLIPGSTATFTTLTGAAGLATSGGPAFDTTKTCLYTPGTTTCDADGVVTIAGEGTYTLNQSTGVVTYTALANATAGTKTPITYKVVDITGASVTSTLTPIIPPPPTVRADTAAGQMGSTMTIPLLSNDAPGSAATDLDPQSIRLCQVDNPATTGVNEAQTAPDCTATSVVKPEGTFTLDPVTGILTFTPNANYTGTLPAYPSVDYIVKDTLGQAGSGTATVTLLPPPATTAMGDTGSAAFRQPVTFDPLSNDSAGSTNPPGYTTIGTTALDPTSVKLCDPVTSACNLTTLTVLGEGTYSVNPTTGAITFTPDPAFVGTPVSPPTYQVCNIVSGSWAPATPNSTCSKATVTPTIAAPSGVDAVADSPAAGAWDTTQTINVLSNDTVDPLLALDPTSVHLCATGQTAPNCTATSLTVPNVGTYTVNNDGTITFDPLPSFTGIAPAVTYQVSDNFGQTDSATLTTSVTAPAAPVATDASLSIVAGTTQTFPAITSGSSPLATGTQLQPLSTYLCQVDNPATSGTNEAQTPPNCSATSVTIPNVGTYSVNQATGVVSFTSLAGVTTASSVDYVIKDVTGQTDSGTLTAAPVAPPVATDDTKAIAFDQTTVIDVLANDTHGTGTTLVASTVKLCADGESPTGCTATTLVVPNVGTYTVKPNGSIEFNPLATFSGTAPAVTYQVADGLGQIDSATLTVTVTTVTPTAAPDAASGAYDTNIVFTPTSNDSAGSTTNFGSLGYTNVGTTSFDPASVKLCAANETVPNCTQTSLTTADGVYTVNSLNGQVTFNPDADFFGSATQPVTYVACNTMGGNWLPAPAVSCITSTITPTTAQPIANAAINDSPSVAWDVPTTINVLGNDITDPALAENPATVKLCGTGEVSPNCTQTTLTVPNEGTYTVNPDGTVTFDPLATFTGTASPVTYQVTDTYGQTDPATITATVAAAPAPTLNPDTASGGQGQPQSKNVLTNDSATNGVTLNGSTLKLCAANQTAPNCGTTVGNNLTVAGVGTYSVDASGVLTFAPAPGYTGTPAPVTYQVTDSAGRVLSSTFTPTVIAAPTVVADTSTSAYNQPVTENVLSDDSAASQTSLVTGSLKLYDPATSTFGTTPVTVPGEGTYSIVNNQVVFTPLSSFAGTAIPVTYQIADALGATSTTTYTPTVTPPTAPDAQPQSKVVGPTSPATFTNVIGSNALASGTGLQSGATNGPAFVCPVSGATTCTDSSIIIPGQGTWSMDQSTGVATFTLASGVSPSTTLTPVTYEVTDAVGQTDTAVLTPTINPAPTLVADTVTVNYGAPITGPVLSNDSAAGTAALVPASLKLLNPATNTFGTSPVTVVGEGTYSIANNQVVFTPETTFSGTATPVTYQVTDTLGTVATTTFTPTITTPAAPDAQPQSKVVGPTSPATFTNVIGTNALASGTGLQTGAANGPAFVCPVNGATTCTDTTVVIPGQGTWTMDQSTGVATFTLASGVSPSTTLTPVSYEVTDAVGQSDTAVLTPVMNIAPTAQPDTLTSPYNTPATKSVLTNDAAASGNALVPSSLQILNPATSTYGTSPVTIANQGTYSIVGDQVVFTPLVTFSGTATPVTYRETDTMGSTATTTFTPTILAPLAPVATPDTEPVGPSTPAVFPNIIGSTPTTLPLATGTELQAGASNGPAFVCPVTGATTCTDSTVVVAGQGTWTMNQTTGVATFTLANGVSAGTTLTPVTYEVTDVVGQTASATLTPIMPPAPTATPDASYGQQGDTQIISLLGNDRPGTTTTDLVPSTVTLSCPPCASGSTVTSTSVTIPGEGVYTVLSSGVVSFVPDPAFTGTGTTLTYTVRDEVGQIATTTFAATVWPPPAPTAVTDTGSAAYGQTVTFSPWINDSPGTTPAGATEPDPNIVASSIRLCAVGETVPNCTATTVTTDDGTYVLNTSTGQVVFTPVARFTGTATSPVTYQIANDWTGGAGIGHATASLIPTIAPPGSPVATNDTLDTPPGVVVNINPVTNDIAGTGTLVASSVRLCDVTEIAPSCAATSVTVPEGVFTVNVATGVITFSPNSSFDEEHPATVPYVITDSLGLKSSANILITDSPVPVVTAPIVAAIDNLVHTGTNAGMPLVGGAFAAVVGMSLIYYSRQRMVAERGPRVMPTLPESSYAAMQPATKAQATSAAKRSSVLDRDFSVRPD